jgi:hypothetical protein
MTPQIEKHSRIFFVLGNACLVVPKRTSYFPSRLTGLAKSSEFSRGFCFLEYQLYILQKQLNHSTASSLNMLILFFTTMVCKEIIRNSRFLP